MTQTKLCPPFFHYPEDRTKLLALAGTILGQTDGWESEEARELALLVEAILQDEEWMFKNAPELAAAEALCACGVYDAQPRSALPPR